MNPLRTVLFGVVFALLALLPGCQKYDTLVEKNAVCDEKWADVEAQLQRRYDLVPNLVATVKGSDRKATPAATARRACQELQGRNVVGVVLNAVEEAPSYGSSYYYYGPDTKSEE